MPTKDGRWFSIRIMPYRTLDDRIDGIVITFFNISDLKEVEVKLHETEQLNRLLLNSTSDIIIKLSTDLKIAEMNPSAETILEKSWRRLRTKIILTPLYLQAQREKTKIDLEQDNERITGCKLYCANNNRKQTCGI